MVRDKREQHTAYRPTPYKNRFWLHSEHCYTEEDIAFRTWILKIRANSGIDPDYLTNPSSWFAEDSQAFTNIYENSWFFSNAFKTTHMLSRDDFHVQPIDTQRMQWPALYDLMQNVGDYLLLRNHNLPIEHLNQPMNYVFLDLNFILKQLSQNTNAGQVRDQLILLTQYVRKIEKNISPNIGSDRLFMANFRRIVDDKIEPQLTHKIETQLLKERLDELSKTIKQLSRERNRILHFALNTKPVNPHPYEFSTPALEDIKTYPTQVAKECAGNSHEVSAELAPPLRLTMEQLKDCPNFKLISMDKEILEHYSKAISDLNELDRFQHVINQIMDLLNQAGEVYTVHQFKKQLLILLDEITRFVDHSSFHLEELIHINTLEYHKAIAMGQNLPLWQKWLTTEGEKLKVFINNQDTLSQFPSTSADLSKTNKILKNQVSEVIRHLNQPSNKVNTFTGLAGQARDLNKLMLSMHQWIKIQYEQKGLAAPNPPEPFELISLQEAPRSIQATMPTKPVSMIHSIPETSSFFCPKPPPTTWCPSQCNTNNADSVTAQHYLAILGLFILIPVGILVLYFLFTQYKQEQKIPLCNGTSEEFAALMLSFEDLLTEIKGFDCRGDDDFSMRYEHLSFTYEKLKEESYKGIYHVEELAENYEDLLYFYEEIKKESLCSSGDVHFGTL